LEEVVYGLVGVVEAVHSSPAEQEVLSLVEIVEAVHSLPDEQEVLNMVVAGVQVQVLQLVVTIGLPAVVTW
jgi:hypothetical protein